MVKFINIKLYNFKDNDVIVLLDDKDDLWFYGNQVAKILGYNNPKTSIKDRVPSRYIVTLNRRQFKNSMSPMVRRDSLLTMGDKETLNDENEYITSYIWKNKNDKSNKTFVNEAGFYKLCFSSKLKEAESFTEWVADEVLSSIRKTGNYISNTNNLPSVTNNDLIIKDDLNELNNSIKKLIKFNNYLNHEVASLKTHNKSLDKMNRTLLEKVDNLNAYINGVGKDFYSGKSYFADRNPMKVYHIDQIAGIAGIPVGKLYDIFLEIGVLLPNDNKLNSDTKYRLAEYCYTEGYAVKFPYSDPEHYPNKYYYRFSEYGVKIVLVYLRNNGYIDKDSKFWFDEF